MGCRFAFARSLKLDNLNGKGESEKGRLMVAGHGPVGGGEVFGQIA